MPAAPPSAPDQPAGSDPEIARWQRELVALGGPNTLLWSDRAVTLDITHAHPGGLAKLLAGKTARLSELYREPAARTRAIARARVIRDKEVELDSERGVPGCYLAMGRATWTERRGPVPDAPVFLRRISLLAVDPAREEFEVVFRGDPEFNPALRGFLESVGGAAIPFDVLVRMSMRLSGFDPGRAYEALGAAEAGPPGWRIVPDLWITTFPYAKLPTLADFRRQALLMPSHPVLGRLAEGAPGPTPADEPGGPADPELVTVLDADPSQVAVIEAVRAGSTVVVDAGPGTGKTQTIVNVAADLARAGRRALVLAAPAEARATIAGRLSHLGLDGILAQPGVAAAPAAPLLAPSAARAQADFSSAGRELRDHDASMHASRAPWGVSLDALQERIAGLCQGPTPPRSKVRLDPAALQRIDRNGIRAWSDVLTGLAADGAWRMDDQPDPWWGADLRGPDEVAVAHGALAGLSDAELDRMAGTVAEVFAGVTMPRMMSLGDYGAFVTGMSGIGEVLERFRLGIFDAPLGEWADTGHGGAVGRWRHSRAIKGLLRPGAPPADVDRLLQRAREVRPLWLLVRGSEVMPGQVVDIDRARDAVGAALEHARRLGALLPGTPDLVQEDLGQLRERVRGLTRHRDRIGVLADASDDLRRLREAGFGALVDDLADRGVPAERVAVEAEFAWAASVLDRVTDGEKAYVLGAGDRVRSAVARFRESDRSVQRATAAGVAADGAGAEPLIWLCSPYTAALDVPADLTFDAVLIDEAGSLPVAAAVTALARAPQALIAGDRRQPGPTPFTVTAGGVPPGGDSVSLLDAAATVWPARTLAWHYRSRDERLIDWVNLHAYAGAMRLFPAMRDESRVAVRRVETAEQPGALVAAALAAVRANVRDHPGESVVVVAMDESTAVEVRAALVGAGVLAAEPGRSGPGGGAGDGAEPGGNEARGAGHARSEAGGTGTPVNAVAGPAAGGTGTAVEAPVVIVADHAAGVVRDAAIVLLDHEAPVRAASAEGMRRLTAALTRARSRLTVLHDIDHEPLADASPQGPQGPGPRLLADILSGARPEPEPGVTPVLVGDLARRLTARGLAARPGIAPGLVDLAVGPVGGRGSGRLIAVQVDGPHYHALGGLRMRDRLVHDQLRRLGWRPLLIRTADLFRDPAREEARVAAALERLATGDPDTGPVPAPRVRRASRPGTGAAGAPDVSARRFGLDQTRDDTAAGWGERPTDSGHDRWLRENRPPHWD